MLLFYKTFLLYRTIIKDMQLKALFSSAFSTQNIYCFDKFFVVDNFHISYAIASITNIIRIKVFLIRIIILRTIIRIITYYRYMPPKGDRSGGGWECWRFLMIVSDLYIFYGFLDMFNDQSMMFSCFLPSGACLESKSNNCS